MTIINDDCLHALREMADNSVDAIITDPPYGLSNTTPAQVADTIREWATGNTEHVPHKRGGFMGKEWDSFVPPPAVWVECLRVLKPGGHMLVFAGSRTQDLMGLSVRLAGFDLRDSVAWLYGSGFPKSHDISKNIDKMHGAEREVVGLRTYGDGQTYQGGESSGRSSGHMGNIVPREPSVETAPATSEAARWSGWGTALKPAHEPIIMARKPFKGTVAGNVLAHGTGAINVDACRIEGEANRPTGLKADGSRSQRVGHEGWDRPWKNDERAARKVGDGAPTTSAGRWPANVLLDEHAAAWVDEQSGITKSNVRPPTGKDDRGKPNTDSSMTVRRNDTTTRGVSDQGGASRFFTIIERSNTPCAATSENATTTTATTAPGATPAPSGLASSAQTAGANGELTDAFLYTAKAPKSERPNVDGVQHPTVKPLAIMRWLIRLVTPPGGTVLDPFAGSGTTLEAATLEGFTPIGIEADPDYIPLIEHRLERATK